MKFGHTLYDLICNEWHPFAVDYKGMKRVLKGIPVDPDGTEVRIDTEEFFRVYEASKTRIYLFYSEREQSARNQMRTLQKRVRALHSNPSLGARAASQCETSACDKLKEKMSNFEQHLDLLIEFLDLNKTGFSKILKKFDKRVGSCIREEKFAELMTTHRFLDGEILFKLKEELEELQGSLLQLECREVEIPAEDDYSRQVADMLSWIQENSTFFKENEPRALPRFKTSEIVVGPLLGKGEFGVVKEISQFKVPESCHICFFHKYDAVSPEPSSFLVSNVQDAQDSTSEEKLSSSVGGHTDSGSPEVEALGPVSRTPSDVTDFEELEGDHEEDDAIYDTRGYMKDHCLRDGSPRYAIKRLRKGLSGEMQEAAAYDIAVEAKFLAVLAHPNIVKMRASGGVPGRQDFFIVMDRLYGTLAEKCEVWAEHKKKAKGFFGFRKDKSKLDNMWVDRLLAMFDVARAMRYMHSKKIIFRDLKPENIGFDVRGDAKIFDFGLAKELLPADKVGHDQFNASGMTGTRRYMAPEVALCKPYGLSADVYSFSILLWEVLSLKPAFKDYDYEMHAKRVVLESERPRISSSWPVLLKILIVDAWSSDTKKRPPFSSFCDLLRSEISKHDKTNMSDRSADLLTKSDSSRYKEHEPKQK